MGSAVDHDNRQHRQLTDRAYAGGRSQGMTNAREVKEVETVDVACSLKMLIEQGAVRS